VSTVNILGASRGSGRRERESGSFPISIRPPLGPNFPLYLSLSLSPNSQLYCIRVGINDEASQGGYVQSESMGDGL